ncbi:MAG: carboxypeptidase regulatory-like domain-containing protein [Planctomycetes bacterium]|nr:carboxypeptidase regulatory-like domain-containing protein [Planctomycetota bacterium]
MGRQLVVAILAVVVALGVWFLWQTLGETPAAPSGTSVNTDRPIDERSSEMPSPSIADESAINAEHDANPSRVEVAERSEWRVIGDTVSSQSREPYPGVAVRVRVWDGYAQRGEPRVDETVVSDAAAKFGFACPPPTGAVVVAVSGAEPDHESYGSTQVVAPGEAVPLLRVWFSRRDSVVAGTVRDTRDTPIEGATIRAGQLSSKTDEHGRYELPAASASERVYVYATAAGFAQSRATATTKGTASRAIVDFELRPSLRVVGRVVDESGQPLEGARVTSFFTNRNVVESDRDGRFTLDHLDPERESHDVYARLDGYVEASAKVASSGTEVQVPDFVMRRGGRIAGRVVDEVGTALPAIDLYIGFSPSAYNRLDAVSGDDGDFEFLAVPFGDQNLVTLANGFAPSRQVVVLSESRRVIDHLEIRLTRGHFVGGVVLDESGSPRTGVGFAARHAGEYIDKRGRTDDVGRFRVDGLPMEQVDIEFFGEGVLRTNVPVTSFDRADLEFVVPSSGGVAGRVVDGTTGSPLEKFRVRFVGHTVRDGDVPQLGYSATWGREGHRFSGTDGYWDSGTESLVPGAPIGIEVRADGYAPALVARVLCETNPDPDELVIRMSPGGHVSGRVVDASGVPVAAAHVAVRAVTDERRTISPEPYETGVDHTDADGAFSFDAVAPGSTVLIVEAEGKPAHVDGPFEVTDGVRVDRVVQMPDGAKLRGRLLDASGTPLGGETICLNTLGGDPAPSYSAEVLTDAEGWFEFGGLADGLFQVGHRIRDAGQSAFSSSGRVRLVDGSAPDFVLRPTGTGKLIGTLRMQDGSDVPDAVSITCVPIEGTSRIQRGTIARGGRFEIEAVEESTYAISAYYFGTDVRLIGNEGAVVVRGATSVELELRSAWQR